MRLAIGLLLPLFFLASCSPRTREERPQQGMNRLQSSSSAYLRSAAHQPVHWYEWGEEPFAAAKAQDKPVLLDIGAVWCHWCHVIDRESYENPEIAELINAGFIAVKVDVDARPDIDRRYQEVVQAISGQGGWPLTAFLTPEGEVIYGGTYFPPEDRWGMPGMKTVLKRVAQVYRENKSEVLAQANRLHMELERFAVESIQPGELGLHIVERMARDLEGAFDEEEGGFGDSPKFPPPAALGFLLRRHLTTGEKKYLDMVTKTLDAMEAGGIRDQLGGAFHRYSTDRQWRVPHFEVMLYANAEMLKVYADAYRLTGEARYAAVTRELLGYLRGTLSDNKEGGFYGSQDADATLHEDGDYWTWTLEEAKAVLSPEELEVAGRYYGIEEQGEMKENPAKNVLYKTVPAGSLAKLIGRPQPEVEKIIAAARAKLLAARAKRKAPSVDRAVYVNWNGLMVSAMLAASIALEEEWPRQFALKTLDRIWKRARPSEGGLVRIIQEGKGQAPALLDDYACLLQAFLDAYEISQEPAHLERARTLAEEMTAGFWDAERGGFFDVRADNEAMTILRRRRKPIQDSPTPAPNSVAACSLTRLWHYTGDEKYKEQARKTLAAFAGTAQEQGYFAASFAIALEGYLQEPAKVVILGKKDVSRTADLLRAALAPYRPDRVVVVADPGAGLAGLPAPVVDIARNLGTLRESTAFVCSGTACASPTDDPERLKQLVGSFGLSRVTSGE